MAGLYILTVRLEFAAAHNLRNFCGKCEALHGHNYQVEVQVQGRKLDADNGMLLDFGVLKKETKTVLQGLDHKYLNDLPEFCEENGVNPSSENLARHIYQQIGKRLAAYENVSMRQVTVFERSIQSATYMED